MSDNESVLPLLVFESEKDERFEGVILLTFDDEIKTTAEDCGSCWRIRDWEVYDIDDTSYWLTRSWYSIEKDVIKVLAEASQTEE